MKGAKKGKGRRRMRGIRSMQASDGQPCDPGYVEWDQEYYWVEVDPNSGYESEIPCCQEEGAEWYEEDKYYEDNDEHEEYDEDDWDESTDTGEGYDSRYYNEDSNSEDHQGFPTDSVDSSNAGMKSIADASTPALTDGTIRSMMYESPYVNNVQNTRPPGLSLDVESRGFQSVQYASCPPRVEVPLVQETELVIGRPRGPNRRDALMTEPTKNERDVQPGWQQVEGQDVLGNRRDANDSDESSVHTITGR